MKNYSFLKFYDATDEQIKKLRAMRETFFQTQQDPEQLQVSQKLSDWLKNKLPECVTIILLEQEVVGSALIIPCTNKMMHDFLAKKISEAQLVVTAREENVSYENMQAIYLCSAFIAEPHRGKALAAQAIIRSIKWINPTNKNLTLFCWAYSPEGSRSAHKIANALGATLLVRESK